MFHFGTSSLKYPLRIDSKLRGGIGSLVNSKLGPISRAWGGGFFHSKGTWGCAAREGILFRTSSLAKGVLFGNFSRVRSRQGYAFWEFWSKRCQNSVIFVKKTQLLKNFGLENAKIWQVLPRKCQFRALLKEKLV